MPREEHHVVPNPDGGWDVKRSGSKRASAHTKTKKEAVDKARKMSIRNKTELVIHNTDGKISNSDSHGNDPCPPLDKK